jgi:transposase-like protein
MVRRPRSFIPEFKAKIVLDILVMGKSLGEASREYDIKDSVLSRVISKLSTLSRPAPLRPSFIESKKDPP